MLKKNILVLGDSHMRVFNHWLWRILRPGWRFTINYVPGATISGIGNVNSASGARLSFNNALEKRNYTHIFVGLGEVDMGYALWIRAKQKKTTPENMLQELIANYSDFLQELADFAPVTLISAPFQTVTSWTEKDDEVSNLRKKVAISLCDRNKMTMQLNDQLKAKCLELGLNFVDGSAVLDTDLTVKPYLRNPSDPQDHHYRRGVYALWLATRKLTH